jgi:hypothetical protein
MYPSVEQLIEEYRKASESLRREIEGDPVKAREFLISAGIRNLRPVPNDHEPVKTPAWDPD